MDVKLPDGMIVQNVPDGMSQEDLLGHLLQAGHPSAQSLLRHTAQQQTLGDMSGLEKFNAGMGLAFQNIGRAAKQVVGLGSDYQENRGVDRALTSTGAGLAGNIAGNIAAFAPAAVIPGANTIAGTAALGGITAAFQPTDTPGERMRNMALGTAMGGITQGAAQYPNQIYEGAKTLAKKPFQVAHAAVEPLYEGGQRNILARTLADATGPNRAQVIANLNGSQALVPGSLPTAAEAGESGGLAALQRSAAAVDPESYATRAMQQNEARVAELHDLAGTMGQRGAMEANRDSVAHALYGKALDLGVDQAMASALRPQINNLMERAPSGIVEKAKELARLNGETIDKVGSLNGLHWMKLAVDDMLSSGKSTGIGAQTTRAVKQYKNDLLSTIDDLSPSYATARTTFQTMSRPVNQMDIAQTIADKSINKLTGAIQPQSYARALSDDTAAAATGFDKATLENTLEPQQLARLFAIKGDLARSVMARDLGRGAGSDTAQKLAMTNLMQRSGLPMGVLNLPGFGRIGNWLYQNADQEMRQRLAQTLLDPRKTAEMMEGYKPYIPMGAPSQQTKDRAALLGRMLLLPAATAQQ